MDRWTCFFVSVFIFHATTNKLGTLQDANGLLVSSPLSAVYRHSTGKVALFQYTSLATAVPATSSSCTTLYSNHLFQEDDRGRHSSPQEQQAQPLPLSKQDRVRLQKQDSQKQQQSRSSKSKFQNHMVMPIVLLDALLPHQRLYFSSADPKFERLIVYLRQTNSNQLGMMGFDPQTGFTLDVGVICTIPNNNHRHQHPHHHDREHRFNDDTIGITYGLNRQMDRVMATSFKATSQFFQVVGDPWLDPTDSFYMAHVQVQSPNDDDDDNDEQDIGGVSRQVEYYYYTEQLFASIPTLVQQWKQILLYHAEWMTPAQFSHQHQLQEIGTEMPSTKVQRAVWVVTLLNPVGKIPLSTIQQEHALLHGLSLQQKKQSMTCPDVRPAMLSSMTVSFTNVDNDDDDDTTKRTTTTKYDKDPVVLSLLLLSVTALQSSIDFLQRYAQSEQERKQHKS